MERLALLALVALASPAEVRGDEGAVPVLVELFTSEGCSSCPPADALLARLVATPPPGIRLIALGEHVDYWDGAGWKDRFSSGLFTRRQEAYARALGETSVYTPELVAGGRRAAVGSDELGVRRAISKAAHEEAGAVDLRLAKDERADLALRVEGSWAKGVEGEVVAALVKDRAESQVSGGENKGRTLDHVAVVLALKTVGKGRGRFSGRASFEKARADEADRVVVFVEEPDGGPVRAVASEAIR